MADGSDSRIENPDITMREMQYDSGLVFERVVGTEKGSASGEKR
jgi:hypothetical protein